MVRQAKGAKKDKGMSSKQIAELTNLPERTVARIFSGDTDNPYVDTLRRIVGVLDGSLDDIFSEGSAVVGGKKLESPARRNRGYQGGARFAYCRICHSKR